MLFHGILGRDAQLGRDGAQMLQLGQVLRVGGGEGAIADEELAPMLILPADGFLGIDLGGKLSADSGVDERELARLEAAGAVQAHPVAGHRGAPL